MTRNEFLIALHELLNAFTETLTDEATERDTVSLYLAAIISGASMLAIRDDKLLLRPLYERARVSVELMGDNDDPR